MFNCVKKIDTSPLMLFFSERPPDGAKLSFKEKMKLFAQEVSSEHYWIWFGVMIPSFQVGENTPRDKAKISKAQREIDSVE